MARVLVVDDDPIALSFMSDALRAANHDVTEATDGEQAIALFCASPFDIVVTDVLMPVKDGVELILGLRDMGATVPILAISGGGQGVPGELCLRLADRLGAEWTMRKPFQPQQLAANVSMCLTARRGGGR